MAWQLITEYTNFPIILYPVKYQILLNGDGGGGSSSSKNGEGFHDGP